VTLPRPWRKQREAEKDIVTKQKEHRDKATAKVHLFHGEIGGHVAYDPDAKVYIPDVVLDPETGEPQKAAAREKRARDVSGDTVVFDSPRAAIKEAKTWY
jgi:hypothetical protein